MKNGKKQKKQSDCILSVAKEELRAYKDMKQSF